MSDDHGPAGLSKSLDDLISEQRQQKKRVGKDKKKGQGSKSNVSKRGDDQYKRNRRERKDIPKDRMLTDRVFRIKGSGAQKRHGRGRTGHDHASHPTRFNGHQSGPEWKQHGTHRGRGRSSGRGRGRGRGQSFMNFGNLYMNAMGYKGQQHMQPGDSLIPGELFEKLQYSLNTQGVLVVAFDGHDVAQISPTGDVYVRLPSTLIGSNDTTVVDAINHVLRPIDVKVIVRDVAKNDFQISDGSSLVRYHDGVVVQGKGQIGRATMVMHHLQSQSRIGGQEVMET